MGTEVNKYQRPVASWFRMNAKDETPFYDIYAEEWDGTTHAERNEAGRNFHQMMWESYNQDDLYNVLANGYIMRPRGIYERNEHYPEMAYCIMWIRDKDDPIQVMTYIQEKLGVLGEHVDITVYWLNRRIEGDNPMFWEWESSKIDDFVADTSVTEHEYTKI